MKSIDLNCDMGESYGRFVVGNDKDIMPHISSCNIACGFHGGDPLTIERTIKLALEHRVAVGAHPSYPDLAGFGRRAMHIHQDELKAVLTYQICALKGMTEALGGKLHHVKPHGALYNAACRDDMVAAIICKCIRDIDPELMLYGAGDNWHRIAESSNVNFVPEVFADRNYNDDLTLVSRSENHALITDIDQSIHQIQNIIFHNKLKTVSGHEVKINAKTICIHGDEPGAPDLALKAKNSLKELGVEIAAPKLR